MYARYVKRLLDFILSLVGLIILSPVFLVVAFLIRIKLGSPVLFKQERPGKDEKIFTLYKFRTMTDERDKNGKLLSDEVRLTDFGKFLRSTSLDELPELINIMKGNMSIVGPRPLAVVYLPWYDMKEKHRHDVRPGLTGLAQISGRNGLQWEERFKKDIEYISNITFINDFKIILYTVKKTFIREDVLIRGTSEIIDFHIYRKQQLEEKNNGNR